MAGESEFLHGLEVQEISDGIRTITTASTSVIGLIGTAPNANPLLFPLNKPILIAGSRIEAAQLDPNNTGAGTLPQALDDIFDQTGAVVVVVRVAAAETEAEQLANILGGANGVTGSYEGVHCFLGAKAVTGAKPKIFIAPGFTHTRRENAIVTVNITDGGQNYTSAPEVKFTGGGGIGVQATAQIKNGAVVGVTITKPGSGYTSAPTVEFIGGGGTGAAGNAVYGTTSNAVVAELVGIADRMGSVIIADGPSTTDAAAIAYRKDFGSRRVYVVDPRSLITDSNTGNTVTAWSSPRVAGLIAKSDNERGFWWSPSNQVINGITGTERAIDFEMGDASSRANRLNENQVATIIREDGFRLWGNQTCSSDQKWKFLSVVRTSDAINESLMTAHLWAVDRGITKNYVDDVIGGIDAYLRHLKSIGAIDGGSVWLDKDLNTPEVIASGHIYFDFDFTPTFPAERVTFRSHMTNGYISEVIS